MTSFQPFDPGFAAAILPGSRLEKLHEGMRWSEGPVYFADGRFLLFNDIPNNRMLRWDEASGQVSLFRAPSDFANGNTRDREGRLVTCEHGTRRVTRTEYDGSITVLAERFEGKRFNSPNDVVVKSDGTIWFTDPSYGILSDHEGYKADSEIGACHVYRLDPRDGSLRIVADDFAMPNGLAFSADEKTLYIADSGLAHRADRPHHVRTFAVEEAGHLTGGDILAEIDPGAPDGLRVDVEGRLWIAAGDGVQCWSPDGRLLGKILVPEEVANLCFGGPRRNRLFITASSALYAVELGTQGIQRP